MSGDVWHIFCRNFWVTSPGRLQSFERWMGTAMGGPGPRDEWEYPGGLDTKEVILLPSLGRTNWETYQLV